MKHVHCRNAAIDVFELDVCNIFVGSAPVLDIYKGEIPTPALGMRIEAWTDDGEQTTAGHMVSNAMIDLLYSSFT
jgi:hypothetical protein